MNSGRRAFVRAAGSATVGLAFLSGCLDDTGTDDTTPNGDRSNGTDGNESRLGSAELPSGVSEEGVTDFDSLANRTATTYRERDVRIRYEKTRTIPSYNSVSETIVIDPDAKTVRRDERERDDDGSVTGFFRLYVSLESEIAYSHHMEAGLAEDPQPVPEALEYDFPSLVEELYSDVVAPKIAFVDEFEHAPPAEERTDSSGSVLEATEKGAEFALPESEIDGSAYELRSGELTLSAAGDVLGYRYDLLSGDHEYTVELETELEDTTVSRPEWVDDAVRSD